jgi:hypothetical protein
MNAKCSLGVWVLLEFGVKESWIRLATIGLQMDLERYGYLTEFSKFAMLKYEYFENFVKI